MPYILSPEQKVVVRALAGNEPTSTKYFDFTTALQAVCVSCLSALQKNQKILLHLPDFQQRSLLISLLQNSGLSDLTIDLSEKANIPETDIIKLRSTGKKQLTSDAIITNTLSGKKEETLKKKIDQFYLTFDTKVMADAAYRDFVANTIYLKKADRPTLMLPPHTSVNPQFTSTEYYQLKKDIRQATQLYYRSFELYDHLSLFKEDLWNEITDEKTNQIKAILQDFKTETTLLVQDFMHTSQNLVKQATKELNRSFEKLEVQFSQHEEACIAYQIKNTYDRPAKEGVLSIFQKKRGQDSNKIYVEAFDVLSGMIQDISQSWYDELEAPTTEMITYDYIIDFIAKNREKAAYHQEKLSQSLQNTVQRINRINTSSEEVKRLDKRLESLIHKLNDSQFFDITLEHNILSFFKQVELSQKIAEFIEKCHILVHSSASYLEWKSFYNSASRNFQQLFAALKKYPKEAWFDTFEFWFERQVHRQALQGKTITKSDLSEFYSKAQEQRESASAALIAKLHKSRLQAASQLKSSTKELYNTLFKKKQLPNVSWSSITLMNRPFLQAFFPIHITECLAHAQEYDLVVSFSKEEETHSNIHYFSPIETEDIKNMSEQNSNFLYLNDYNYHKPLHQLSSTDKLKASKKLAKYILSLNQNIKIYQLKNANIISLLPGMDDAYMEQILDKVNVKVIDTQGVLYDRLTESILFTERTPYLILKDELINPELHEHTLWQLKIINLFREVGYEVLSLNTTRQLHNNGQAFAEILTRINSDSSIEQEEKNVNPIISETPKVQTVEK